jgi:hypothetical protein
MKKGVSDLGAAAYIFMHEYEVIGKQDKSVYFEIEPEQEKEFLNLKKEYLSSEFHRFDSCLMALKKMEEEEDLQMATMQPNKFVTDLGAAAFLLMHKFKIIGRKGKAIYFEVANQEEEKQFDHLYREYLHGDFHKFDSCLMSLKKLSTL